MGQVRQMKLSERETVDNKQEQAREDKRCTKEAQEADKDAGRQGKVEAKQRG